MIAPEFTSSTELLAHYASVKHLSAFRKFHSFCTSYGYTRFASYAARAARVERIKAHINAMPSVPICYPEAAIA